MRLPALAMTLCLLTGVGAHADEAMFKLEAVRSGTRFGPFAFQTGALVRTDTGTFRIDIRQGHAFNLVSTTDPTAVYGVYELTLGRMIEVGDGVFTIVGLVDPATPPGQPAPAGAARGTGFLHGCFVGARVDLFSRVLYDWKANDLAGGKEENLKRNAISVELGRGYFTARFGLVTGAEWDNTIVGDTATFANATLTEGRGWFVSLATRVPVFTEGPWQSHITGELAYRQEDYKLGYSTVGISGVTTTFSTNVTAGVTNVQPATVTTNFQFTAFDRDASLTETSLRVGIDLAYVQDAWSAYGGISVYPVLETDLSAGIRTPTATLDIEFERTHPVVVSGGVSADILGLKWYLEGDVGSETTLRAGVRKTF